MNEHTGTKKRVAIVLETSIQAQREILNGVLQYSVKKGNWIVQVFERRYDEQSAFALDTRLFDGAIGQFHCPRYSVMLKKADIPLVITHPNTGRVFKMKPPFLAYLDCDNSQIGVAAAEYFLKDAYESFAFVPTQVDAAWSDSRCSAFVSRLMNAGHVCNIFPQKKTVRGTNSIRDEEALAKWLVSLPKPAAVFAVNDTRAHHVLNACLRAGIAVPDDLALLGCDNNASVCEALQPSLSSISLATESAGYRAAQALDYAMCGEPAKDSTPKLITYGAAGIVLRGSTDRQYSKDILVRRAIELIRSSGGIQLSISGMADEFRTSRRTLELRFKRQTGKTLHAAITAAKLATVKSHILHHGMSVAETAARCGYANPAQLSAAFRKLTGMTIRQFRKTATPT